MRTWRWLPTLLMVPLLAAAERAAPAPAVRTHTAVEAQLRRDITFLASDDCEGRGPGTRGIDKAADYVAEQFKKAGLKPAVGDSYFQPFTIKANVLDEPGRLVLKGPQGQTVTLKQGVQFWPMALGGSGGDSAPAVFAGYGISSKQGNYDDYAGIDAAHKVVLVLRGAPPCVNKDRARELMKGASFTSKISNAEKHEAAAILIVNDADTARDGDDLLDFNYTAFSRSAGKVPTCHVRRSVLEMMLPGGADALAELENDINRELKPHSRELPGWTATVQVWQHRGTIDVKNVVGVLEGAGPLANETVVIGAHYDHLGYGNGYSLSRLKKRAIHHGADDNASGTTVLIELARRFAAPSPLSPSGGEGQGVRGRRRLVFIAFSGEELGLFGSEYYCKNPIYPLKDTAAMFNLDMVGRLRPDKDSGKPKLLTEGCGTAKPFRELLDKLGEKHGFKMINKADGFGPSDHASFCTMKVPVLFAWSDYHDDYHKPSDTADKINVAGMRRIVEFSQDAVTELMRMDKPAYVHVKSAMARPSNGPRLGIELEEGDGEGVTIKRTEPNQPAAKAGLKAGDVIVALAGKPVKKFPDLLKSLKSHKAGDTIEVRFVRNGKPMSVKVKLESAAMHANMPRLGIRPSYSYEGEGVLLNGVSDNLPAAAAGLQKDDVIVRIAGKPVKDLQDYMEALGAQKPGNTIEVVIVRGGKKKTVKVKLE
jgi:hypothetical protein